MSLEMPRDEGGRGVVDVPADIISDRYIAPVRESIGTRTINGGVMYDRVISTRDAIQPRDNGRSVIDDYTPPTNTDNPQAPTPTVTVDQPFGQTLASYFSPSGGTGGRAYDTPISVVAGDDGGGSSNTGLILLVLVIGGGAAYWYYKKGGFQ